MATRSISTGVLGGDDVDPQRDALHKRLLQIMRGMSVTKFSVSATDVLEGTGVDILWEVSARSLPPTVHFRLVHDDGDFEVGMSGSFHEEVQAAGDVRFFLRVHLEDSVGSVFEELPGASATVVVRPNAAARALRRTLTIGVGDVEARVRASLGAAGGDSGGTTPWHLDSDQGVSMSAAGVRVRARATLLPIGFQVPGLLKLDDAEFRLDYLVHPVLVNGSIRCDVLSSTGSFHIEPPDSVLPDILDDLAWSGWEADLASARAALSDVFGRASGALAAAGCAVVTGALQDALNAELATLHRGVKSPRWSAIRLVTGRSGFHLLLESSGRSPIEVDNSGRM